MGADRTDRPEPTARRVTVSEAAGLLGITPEAVRMRIKRGTLTSERRDGRVFVLLGPDRPTEHTTERTDPTDHRDELIAHLRSEVEAWREAARRKDHLLAAALERIPALEAPQEARESPVSPGPSDTPTPAPEEAQEAAEPPRDRTNRLQQELLETRQLLEDERSRPWWRRWFGG